MIPHSLFTAWVLNECSLCGLTGLIVPALEDSPRCRFIKDLSLREDSGMTLP